MILGVVLASSLVSSFGGEGAVASNESPAAPPPSVAAPPSAPPSSAPPPSEAPPSAEAAPPSAEAASPSAEAAPPSEAPHPRPAAAASEPAPLVLESVDYSSTWHESPPSSVVVTHVVHRPVHEPPPPAPASYEPRVHGLVGLSLRGTAVNLKPSVLSGGRVGFVFDDRFTVGGAFYSLTARYGGKIVDPAGHHLGLRMSYGGVMLGWSLYRGRVLQVGLETVAGAGAACVSRSRRSYGRWECLERVGMVSIDPGLTVGVLVTDWVRLSLTGGYRFVTREAWREPNDFTLSGGYLGLDLDFGAFRERQGR